MNACLAATCIVVGLGSLLNCCTAEWHETKQVGLLHAMTLVFGGMVQPACTLQELEDNKFFLCGSKAWNHFNKFGTFKCDFNGAELANRYDNRSFVAEYFTLFPGNIRQYNLQEVLDTVQAFLSEQIQTLLKLLFFVIAGDERTINFSKFRAFVRFCLGGVILTEEAKKVSRDIFDQVNTRKSGVLTVDEFMQAIDCIDALGNICIAAEEFIHTQ